MANIKRCKGQLDQHVLKSVFALIVAMLLTGCALGSKQPGGTLGPVMALGVSSDGRYAISTHLSKHLVLWNLEQRSREILSTNANIYSAYFIHDRHAFLWQDLNDQVRVQTIDGEVIQQFTHFPTYGHVMDESLDHYLASTETWDIYDGHGEKLTPMMRDSHSPSVIGSGKMLKLSLAKNGYLVSAGTGFREVDQRPIDKEHPPVRQLDNLRFSSNYAGVVLWDIHTLKPIAKLVGNNVKVDAAISPDGQWVVTGDENGIGLYWNTERPQKKNWLASYTGGIFLEDSPYDLDDPRKFDKSGLIPVPMADKPNRWGGRHLTTTSTVALAFINDSEEFLRFGYRSHWVALFEAGNPWPQKYFDLGDDPHPSTASYLRSLSIATAPKARVLVTGHRSDGGITVYRYDPEARTLTKEWIGE
ncbi:WD40 repeat domain-containing protein [Halomonas sp. GXIMD04776]|uniref:WD40 repeat domain-containing protein n=1 Tax=Halomonas sp. GXIMD04776 TaxID=3415605 RepID=UPI003C9CC6D3